MWTKLVLGVASEKKIKDVSFLEGITVLSLPRWNSEVSRGEGRPPPRGPGLDPLPP